MTIRLLSRVCCLLVGGGGGVGVVMGCDVVSGRRGEACVFFGRRALVRFCFLMFRLG